MSLFLKSYQREAVEVMDQYFQKLAAQKSEWEQVPATYRGDIDFGKKTWEALQPKASEGLPYRDKQTGHGQPCPHYCLRIPTGGGKTLLATYAIEKYLQHYHKRKTGLVLWVVPSDQIFTQTYSALSDRSHPYRQNLDAITGGRVKILRKRDRFSPIDLKDNLCIMIVMLQSFARDKLKKEYLKIFQDDGRFPAFFPAETNQKKHEELLKIYPNLDLVSPVDSLFQTQVKTSLGNVIKISEPFIVLDEGHKAKSDLSKSAIEECNPSAVCELTATPTEEANVLFSVLGRELAKEEMIKLDLNIHEEDVSEWQRVLDRAVKHLDKLQTAADQYRKKSASYIRPICLIQVERVGTDQRDGRSVHAEDVREYLVETGKISPDQVRMKTSVKNEIENEDLLSEVSPVRFIITKQALQEGWDCPFAYVLVTLGSSRSRTALTQLVGRVLRQPYAKKTGVKLLDESYVFARKRTSQDLLNIIKQGFESDGLGDLFERVKGGSARAADLGERKQQKLRPQFEKSLKEFLLPAFVVKDKKKGVRQIDFHRDILPEIDFSEVNLDEFKAVNFDLEKPKDRVRGINFAPLTASDKQEKDFLIEKEKGSTELEDGEFSESYLVRNLLDFVPNPWVAAELTAKALQMLHKRFREPEIASNAIFILEKLRYILAGDGEHEGELSRLARKVFEKKKQKDEIRFVLHISSKILKPESFFEKKTLDYLKKSLYEPTPDGTLNNLEMEFVDEIDKERVKTCWWYRNRSQSGRDYCLSAWQRNKFYPDFIFTVSGKQPNQFDKIYVLETKGNHLAGNTDSRYKKELSKIFSETQPSKDWQQLLGIEQVKKTIFEFVSESELKEKLNKIFIN